MQRVKFVQHCWDLRMGAISQFRQAQALVDHCREGLHDVGFAAHVEQFGREPKLRRDGSGRLPLRRRNGVAEIVQKPHGRNGRKRSP
jgi:hypothetical protein